MSLTWARTAASPKNNTQIVASSKHSVSLKIVNDRVHIKKSQSVRKQKSSSIPYAVRYEKEPASDDEMVISNGSLDLENNDPQRTHTQPIFHPLNVNESLFVFGAILKFMDAYTCIQLMECCVEYSDIFGEIHNPKNKELLKFWKNMYTRTFGRLQWQVRPQKHCTNTKQYIYSSSYTAWKREYESKYSYVRWHAKAKQLYLKRWQNDKACKGPSDCMYIVTKNKIRKSEVFKLRNIAVSNWYRREYQYRRNDDHDCVKADSVLTNMYIGSREYLKAYVYCKLCDMLICRVLDFCVDSKKREMRVAKCRLEVVSEYSWRRKTYDALIIDRIMDIDRFKEEWRETDDLRVSVARMPTNGGRGHRARYLCVVLDYADHE